MKHATSLQTKASCLPAAPGAKRILEAYRAAKEAEFSYGQAVVICGQLLLEQRAAMCQANHNRHTPEDDQFTLWLAQNCPGIAERTARRWMDIAERVMRPFARKLLGHHAAADKIIDIEATPVSEILTALPGSLSGKAAEFHQLLFQFMEDKPISQMLAEVASGESPTHRASRALEGKLNGGTNEGDDRKDYPKFIGLHLTAITNSVCVPRTSKNGQFERNLDEAQRAAITVSLVAALKRWPLWLVKAVKDQAVIECRTAPEKRAEALDKPFGHHN